MREIKFRGKRTDNNKWIYGDLLSPTELFSGYEISDCNTIDGSRYDVDEYTVGQYTGLHDKNGKEIYEGDIVKTFCINEYTNGYVKYNSDKGRFDIGWLSEVEKYKHNGLVGSMACMTNDYDLLEVIGNIYDNPELLEEADKSE